VPGCRDKQKQIDYPDKRIVGARSEKRTEKVESLKRKGRAMSKEGGSKRYYRPDEIAKVFGVHRRTVWRWIKSGKLPTTTSPGGRTLINGEKMSLNVSKCHTILSKKSIFP
jgi:excisionase family DNA binding protein